MRRRNVPCSPCSGGSSSGDCCGLKEKLRILWDRTIGSILRINGISPDGDGDFTIEAGDNIQLTERGTGNGIRIDTTGGVSYYSAGDVYVDVDNNDLKISLVNPGASGGVALHDDLALVADAVSDILDGTSTVPEATHATSADNATSAGSATNAQYLGNNTSDVGTDTKPIKILGGEPVPVPDDFALANWTNVTNDLSKMQTAHEIIFQATENNTFVHSMIVAGSRSTLYAGLSAGSYYLNVSITASGITTISSAGTWTQLTVYVR